MIVIKLVTKLVSWQCRDLSRDSEVEKSRVACCRIFSFALYFDCTRCNLPPPSPLLNVTECQTPPIFLHCVHQKRSLTRSSLLPAGGRHTLPPYRGGSTVPEEYTNQRPPCAPPRLFAPPRGELKGGAHRGCAPGVGEASFEVCALVARVRTESPRGLPGRIMSVS